MVVGLGLGLGLGSWPKTLQVNMHARNFRLGIILVLLAELLGICYILGYVIN